jgi:hypothetical protein
MLELASAGLTWHRKSVVDKCRGHNVGGGEMSPEQLRAEAAWLRQFQKPKAQRAAELAEMAAWAKEKRRAAGLKDARPSCRATRQVLVDCDLRYCRLTADSLQVRNAPGVSALHQRQNHLLWKGSRPERRQYPKEER